MSKKLPAIDWEKVDDSSNDYRAGLLVSSESDHLKLKYTIRKINDDYWFMINLIERYSTDKDETLKDCLERMKFRKPLLEAALKIGKNKPKKKKRSHE